MEEKEQMLEQEVEQLEEYAGEELETKGFWEDDRGVGVIEVVLILVILVGLVLIFKEEITDIMTDAFQSITGDANSILK